MYHLSLQLNLEKFNNLRSVLKNVTRPAELAWLGRAPRDLVLISNDSSRNLARYIVFVKYLGIKEPAKLTAQCCQLRFYICHHSLIRKFTPVRLTPVHGSLEESGSGKPSAIAGVVLISLFQSQYC